MNIVFSVVLGVLSIAYIVHTIRRVRQAIRDIDPLKLNSPIFGANTAVVSLGTWKNVENIVGVVRCSTWIQTCGGLPAPVFLWRPDWFHRLISRNLRKKKLERNATLAFCSIL